MDSNFLIFNKENLLNKFSPVTENFTIKSSNMKINAAHINIPLNCP